MDQDDNLQDDINKLINSAWSRDAKLLPLRELYEKRLDELGITSNQVEKNLQIEYRTLNGILDGNLQRFDIVSLLKIGQFLGIPGSEIVDMYTKLFSEKYKDDIEQAKKKTFILDNFDLAILKNIGVISSIQNFDLVEDQLKNILGLRAITEFNAEEVGAAFSTTKIKPKNDKSRKYFNNKARQIFLRIDNPHDWNSSGLIEYFPKIRWHSMDMENGIVNVIKSLFDLGVTVIFQPGLPSLQIRGATFAVNGKPCIVLTDYREAYPTLWFALLHELFHVLFDWPEIEEKTYHLSDEENDLFVLKQREEEANAFARDYMFPDQKLEMISKRIDQKVLVNEFALDNHIHPSIVYANYAFKYSTVENNCWGRYDKLIRPPMKNLIKQLGNGFSHDTPVEDFALYYRNTIFNIT